MGPPGWSDPLAYGWPQRARPPLPISQGAVTELGPAPASPPRRGPPRPHPGLAFRVSASLAPGLTQRSRPHSSMRGQWTQHDCPPLPDLGWPPIAQTLWGQGPGLGAGDPEEGTHGDAISADAHLSWVSQALHSRLSLPFQVLLLLCSSWAHNGPCHPWLWPYA